MCALLPPLDFGFVAAAGAWLLAMDERFFFFLLPFCVCVLLLLLL